MFENTEIKIILKPDSISWDDISNFLRSSHEKNVENGVIMPYAQLPPEEIRQKIEGRGVMFVAMEGEQLVGTGALLFLEKDMWCGKGKFAYSCFDAVHPDYSGRGVYKAIANTQEQYALSNGVNRIFFDTHEKNRRMIQISKKSGYECINYRIRDDHNSIVLLKWLQDKPYTHRQCYKTYMNTKLGKKYNHEEGKTISSKINKLVLRFRLKLLKLL